MKTTGIHGMLSLTGAGFGSFTFKADTIDLKLGSYLDLNATGLQFNTKPDAALGQDIISFNSINATVTAGDLTLSGGAKNFAIDASGAFITKEGFGVTLGTNVDAGSFKWPSWLPIQIQNLGLTWPNFASDPTNFQIDLSASVNASVPGTNLSLSGFVQDAIIDVGLLKDNHFPITGLKGAGIGVSGDIFGVSVQAELFVAILDLDSSYNVVADPTSPDVKYHVIYGGIDGGFDFEGLQGFEIRLGLSQLGPLEAYVRDDQAVVLEPVSGLTLSNFRGGIDFSSTLPTITDPHQLVNDPAFQNVDDLTLLQWKDRLATQVVNQAKAYGEHPDSPADAFGALLKNMVITGGATLFSEDASEGAFKLEGDIRFDTTGKFEIAGDLALGDSIKVKGYAYLDLSQAAAGAITLNLLAAFPSGVNLLTVYGTVAFTYSGPVPSSSQPRGATNPQLGTGLALNGTTDDVTASGVDLNGTSFSVQFWAKRNATARAETVISQGDGSSGLNIGFDALNNFVVSFGGTSLSVPTPDGHWHEWSVTFDKASGNVAIYEDAIQVKTGTASALTGASTTFNIGKAGSTYFDGSVDEVRVWGAPLNDAAIADDWNRSFLGAAPGLIASWEFNEGQGTTAADTSGNGHDGTLEGSPKWAPTTIADPPSAPFTGFTITVTGGADLMVPGLPFAVSVKGVAQFRTDVANAAIDLNVNGTADIQPIGVGIGLAGFVHFDFAKASDGTFAHDSSGNLIPELYGALAIQPSGLGLLSSIGLNIEDAYAVVRFNTTQTDQSTDLQVTPSMTTNVYIPAHSGSLDVNGKASFRVAGQDIFQLDGKLDAYFNYASGTNQFELDALLAASLILGPTASPLLAFKADGFVQFTNAGVAADFTLMFDAGHSQALQNAGIDLGSADNSFKLELNTTGHDATFTPPSLEDPSTHKMTSDTQTTIAVPAGPHNADGSVGAAGPYLLVDGLGKLNLVNSFLVSGTIDLLVTPNTFKFDLDADLLVKVQSTVLLDLGVKGGILIYDKGVAAGLDLSLKAGLPAGYGFSINATYQLEVNTTGSDQTFTLGATGETLVVPGAAVPYALVHASGDLRAGTFDLAGTFDFRADPSGATIAASAQTTLGPLGSAHVLGTFTIVAAQNLVGQTAGLYGLLQATFATAPSLPGVALNLNFQLLVNTTNVGRTIVASTDPNGVKPFAVNTSTGQVTTVSQLSIPAGTLVVEAGGQLIVASTIDLAGEFDLTVASSDLTVSANATLKGFLGVDLAAHVVLGIDSADALGPGGLVLNAGLTFSSNLGVGILSISANPTLLINTSPVARNGVAANTYEVALNNASVNILGLQASGTLIVGVSDGVFEIDVPASNPLNLSFFGLGNVGLSGYIRSDGHFSVSGSVGFNLGSSIGDLYGGIGVTISDQGFTGSFTGGADLYTIFGTINLASASGSLVIDGSHVHVEASLYVIGLGFSFNFDLGALSPPPPTPAIYWYSVPELRPGGGGQTMLNAQAITRNGPANPSDYVWTVNYNGAPYTTLSGASPTLVFGDPGTYTVHLTAGGLSRDSVITVANVNPTIQSLNLKPGYGYGKPLTIAPTITDPGPTDGA